MLIAGDTKLHKFHRRPFFRSTMASRRSTSGQRLSKTETETLLDLVEEQLPLSGEDWDVLCNAYNERHPNPGQLGEGLRKKFATLWKKKVKTGDPSCPEEVRRAKRIKRNLYEQADMSDLEETGAGGGEATIHEEESDHPIQHAYEDDSSSRGGVAVQEADQDQENRNRSTSPTPARALACRAR